LDGKYKETGELRVGGAMLPIPDIIVSIHGVGEHEPEQVAKELAIGLGANATIPVIDFNWCKVVEGYERDRIVELSGSIANANAQVNSVSKSLRLTSSIAEFLWGALYLVLAMCPLILAPTFGLYIYLPEFSIVNALNIAISEALLTAFVWLIIVTLGITALLFLLSIALMLFHSQRTALWMFRRGALITLRPLVALLFWISSLDDYLKNVGKGVLGLIGLNICGFAIGQLIGGIFGSSWDINWVLRILYLSSVAAGTALVCGAVLGVAAKIFVQPLKFFRDVFNYIGSSSTRQLILDALIKKARDIPPNARVVVACHSLGSVIAVDSLINSNAWKHLESIVLVTGGSPIRRWFQRFFPDLFFPSDSNNLCEIVHRNSPVIAWINVFRPRDPVGADLNLPNGSHTRDVSTVCADLKGINAHADYWRAKDVHEAVRDLWQELSPKEQSRISVPYGLTSIPPSRISRVLSALQIPAIIIAVLSAIVLGIVNYFNSVNSQLEANKLFVQDAACKGTRVTAEVTHRQFWRVMSKQSYPIQKFIFRYTTPEGEPRPDVTLTEVNGGTFGCRQLFDSKSLLKDFRPDEDLDESSTFSVEIAYMDDVVDKIIIPKYKPTITYIPWYAHLVSLVGFLFVGVVICGCIGAILTFKLLYLLVVHVPEAAE
jgi:hypothetical protein